MTHTNEELEWKIHTKSNGAIVAEFATTEVAELNNKTRGDTAAFDLYFDDDPLVVESGETHTIESGTTEIYTDVSVDGTLTIDGTLIVQGDYLNVIQQYADHAGAFASSSTLNNTQLYREQIPDTADVDSIVVGMEPPQKLKDESISGVWGLITSGTDNRTTALTNPVFTFELQILAEYPEYTDHSAVESDLLV